MLACASKCLLGCMYSTMKLEQIMLLSYYVLWYVHLLSITDIIYTSSRIVCKTLPPLLAVFAFAVHV